MDVHVDREILYIPFNGKFFCGSAFGSGLEPRPQNGIETAPDRLWNRFPSFPRTLTRSSRNLIGRERRAGSRGNHRAGTNLIGRQWTRNNAPSQTGPAHLSGHGISSTWRHPHVPPLNIGQVLRKTCRISDKEQLHLCQTTLRQILDAKRLQPYQHVDEPGNGSDFLSELSCVLCECVE